MAAATLAAVSVLADLGAGSVVAVTGAPRTGKTRYVQQAADRGELGRVLVFDPYHREDTLARRRGKPVTPWTPAAIPLAALAADPVRYLAPRDARVVVVPARVEPHRDPDRRNDGCRPGRRCTGCEFSHLAAIAWAYGTLTVIGEEAALYSRECIPSMLRLSSGGGHVDMRLILIAQSFGRLTIDARRHVNAIVAFAQGESSDLDSLRERSPSLADRVRRLRPGDPPAIWRLGETS